MASSTQKYLNQRTRGLKTASLRLSDVAALTTTDYSEILSGAGVPSGAYGRAAGTTLVYVRTDAADADTAIYVSHNGGTDWNAVESSGLTAATLAAVTTGAGASLVGIEDSGALYTATTVEGALAEVKAVADAALPVARAVLATIAVADAGGGATAAALTMTLTDAAGDALTSQREVMILTKDSVAGAYAPFTNPPDISSVTFGSATTGTIVASGGGWCLARTDAAGAFACTASNSGDETIWFVVVTAEGVSNLALGALVVGCVPDSATWSA